MSFSSSLLTEKQPLVLTKIGMVDQIIKVEARFDQIAFVRDLVERCAVEAGFEERDRYAIQLAVCEALENTIIHGFQGESPNLIEARVDSDPGRVRIEIWDDAPPFNPAQSPEEIDWSEDDPPVGGLGLMIIHKVMDEVSYSRKGGRNWLSMLKRLKPPDSQLDE